MVFVDFVAVKPRYALFRLLPKKKDFESIKNQFYFPTIEYPSKECKETFKNIFIIYNLLLLYGPMKNAE